jgi:hypothetical protein
MSTSLRNHLALIAATLLLTVTLALALPDLTREAIVVPIWYVIWIGQLLFHAIPQAILWALLFTIALVVAVRSLLKRPQFEEKPEIEPISTGQVHVLLRWIQSQEERDYFKHCLAQHLGRLTLETLAYRKRLTLREIRPLMGSLDAPPEIRAYLQAGLTLMPPRPGNLFSRLLHRLGWRRVTSPLDLHPEIVVQFVERQLGIMHHMEAATQAVIASRSPEQSEGEAKQSPSRKEEIASSQEALLAMTRADQLLEAQRDD